MDYVGLVEQDGSITARKIKNIFLGKDANKKTLLEVFNLHNEMMKSRVGIDFATSTFTRYNTTRDHIVQYIGVVCNRHRKTSEKIKAHENVSRNLDYSLVDIPAIGQSFKTILKDGEF